MSFINGLLCSGTVAYYHPELLDYFERNSQLLDHLTWKAVILSLIYIFVIRPVFAFIMLWGNDMKKTAEKAAVSFFGIRGIGSLFYLAFALNETGFEDEKLLWSTVAFTITFSIFIHGITASPVMEWLKKKYPEIQEDV